MLIYIKQLNKILVFLYSILLSSLRLSDYGIGKNMRLKFDNSKYCCNVYYRLINILIQFKQFSSSLDKSAPFVLLIEILQLFLYHAC